MEAINTHGLTIDFGMHEGELFTRLPVSYLRWMMNNTTPQCNIAKAEFLRRGDTMPKIELSGHAIDSASIRVRKIWHETRLKDEGLYSWLQRVTLDAIRKGKILESGKIKYMGMKFVIVEGQEFPVLKTIMR